MTVGWNLLWHLCRLGFKLSDYSGKAWSVETHAAVSLAFLFGLLNIPCMWYWLLLLFASCHLWTYPCWALLVPIAPLFLREMYMWTWFQLWCMTLVICHAYLINAIKILIVHFWMRMPILVLLGSGCHAGLSALVPVCMWALQRDWQLYCFGPSLFQSLSHPVTDWPSFIHWLALQCHGWFSFLSPVWACMSARVRAKQDERKYKGDINRAMQPDQCMKTESRQGGWRAQQGALTVGCS